ncbi:MAG TPA: DUF4242 domain-containing protein [Longimicrobiales bacterium]|nr:DUF4242 domain-containing protein [Longimicrobiales bacterium]
MPRYLIERNVPGAHHMSPEELHRAANVSCDALDELAPDVQWQQSYITEDKITCVYVARDEGGVREHARISGFPADTIREIVEEIGPGTAEPRQPAAKGASA